MAEEIIKQLLENPGVLMTGGAAAYGALTYAMGRSRSYTEQEAEGLLEEGIYDSATDYLRGMYDLGKKHSAENELDYRLQEINDPPREVTVAQEETEKYVAEIPGEEPVQGD